MNILLKNRAPRATQELCPNRAPYPAGSAEPSTFQPLTFNAQLPSAFHPRKQGIQRKKHLNSDLAFSPYPLAFPNPSTRETRRAGTPIRYRRSCLSLPCEPFPATIRPMLAKVCSAAVHGIEAFPVEVEVDSGFGESYCVIVVNKTPNPFRPSLHGEKCVTLAR